MNEMIKTTNVFYEYRSHSEEDEKVNAVNGVTLEIKQGEFVVVLGRNGSGKSTLARLMNALLIPKDGTVVIDGLNTRDENLVWEIRNTLGLVFQNPDNQIVATTVEEDVAFGPENLGMEPSKIRQNIDEALKLVGMSEYVNHSPHMLSGGQKQRIAIAGVLAMEPKCIVLDEATSMLDPQGRQEVLEVLHTLNREKKITIVLITHHMDEAAQADNVLVMQEGKLILQGSPKEIFDNVEAIREAGLDVPQVTCFAHMLKENGVTSFDISKLPITMKEAYTGLKELLDKSAAVIGQEKISSLFSAKYADTKAMISIEPLFDVDKENIIALDELSHTYMPGTPLEKKALDKVSLNVKKGEILGIIGHTGSGKSTLVQHLNGILKPTSGSLEVEGLKAEGKALKELRKKVGLIFQYPEHQLFEETVYKDITFGLLKMSLSEEEIKKRVFHVIDLLGLSPELLEKSPFELSGGQKRRVAIAGVLVMQPKVLILDEPTAGLDPKGSQEVFTILKDLNKKDGTTIIIISHNMEDIAALCSRVAVMHQGRLEMCDTARNIFSKADELKSYGLDIPKITELFTQMNKSGYPLPSDVLTVEEAVSHTLKVIDVKRGGMGL